MRGDRWRGTPDLFPNVLTALVAGMTLALAGVLLALGHDMQRRVRVERDLADALAFRKAMEDSLVTGLRARDLQGRVTYVNPAFCRMVGFSADDIMRNDDPVPYWPPELISDYRRVQSNRLTGSLPPRTGFESVFMRKDGSRFPVLIIEAPLIDAHGHHTGWMSAILDISEQRRIEEIQRASEERVQASAKLATMGELASLLSHELNQPLSAIAGYASGSRNLLDGIWSEDSRNQLRVAVERIAQQAERAGKVIRSVHHFVRRQDQRHEVVAVSDLFDAVMPLINLQARNLGIAVQFELESPDLRACCDRTMVEQVLLNLARNGMQAMEHTHDVARILRLRARHVGGGEHPHWLEFAVADFGTGVDAETESRLFQPFFTTKPDGLGLGLSLCRTVVEQHGGALVFERQAPHGTVFRFTIPADTASHSASPAAVPLPS
jgi:two-component system sensor histidine kinase DctS